MAGNIAVVRQELAKLSGVSRSWFEWTYEGSFAEGHWAKTLVVETNFDTDPNSSGFSQVGLEQIQHVIKEALANKTTMTVSLVRIVPVRPTS